MKYSLNIGTQTQCCWMKRRNSAAVLTYSVFPSITSREKIMRSSDWNHDCRLTFKTSKALLYSKRKDTLYRWPSVFFFFFIWNNERRQSILTEVHHGSINQLRSRKCYLSRYHSNILPQERLEIRKKTYLVKLRWDLVVKHTWIVGQRRKNN